MSDRERGPRFSAVREAWGSLSSEQQLGLTIFSVCGALTLIFSVWYLRAQIRAPFLTSRTSLEASRTYVDQKAKAAEREDEQKTKDTDGDGINDWDELNVYHASPYLNDSDSDGILDGVEIAQGTDPNCPKDRDCQLRLDGVNQRSSSSSAQGLLEGIGAARSALPGSTTVGTMTPAEIRAFILSNHLASASDLEGLSDQALMELYQRAARGVQTSNGSASPPPPAPATNAVPSSP